MLSISMVLVSSQVIPTGQLHFCQPSSVGPHTLLVNAQNLLRDTVALAAFNDGGGRGGLRFGERCYFLGHHAARFGLAPRALRRQAHEAERDNALRFPTQPRSLQR
jgi:hypothetical protein